MLRPATTIGGQPRRRRSARLLTALLVLLLVALAVPVAAAASPAASSSVRVAVTSPGSPSSARAIISFHFAGLPCLQEHHRDDEGVNRINVWVPYGTKLKELPAATFILSDAAAAAGARVTVGFVPQVSGTTMNDFTHRVRYTVWAEDGSNRDYVVTVRHHDPPKIGEEFGGGIVVYLFGPGDTRYVEGEVHGLIAATVDQSEGLRWNNGSHVLTEAIGTALGTGAANTADIRKVQGEPYEGYAAGLARHYGGGGHHDWFLPSKDELFELHVERSHLHNLAHAPYWSSSEAGEKRAWIVQMYSFGGKPMDSPKSQPWRVRAVRYF